MIVIRNTCKINCTTVSMFPTETGKVSPALLILLAQLFSYYICSVLIRVVLEVIPLWCHKGHWFLSQLWANNPNQVVAPSLETTEVLSPSSLAGGPALHQFKLEAVNRGLHLFFFSGDLLWFRRGGTFYSLRNVCQTAVQQNNLKTDDIWSGFQ